MKKPYPSVAFLKLNQQELTALKQIRNLPKSKDGKLELSDIILSKDTSMASIVKLSIYSPVILDWCRQNKRMQKTWKNGLDKLGKTFDYKFVPQKKLPLFDLLAGLILASEQKAKKPAEKMLISYIAMEKFHSFYATCFIADKCAALLENNENDPEKIIYSMSRILERFVITQGAPGYFIFGEFCQRIADFFIAKGDDNRAAGALHLGYRYLATACFLGKDSSAEIQNAEIVFGAKHNRDSVSSSLEIFSAKQSSCRNHYSRFISPIEQTAREEAKALALSWNR